MIDDAPHESEGSRVGAVLFSKDRALQLEASLASYYRHCKDAESAHLYVLFKCSSTLHAQQYDTVRDAYPAVEFIAESDFRAQLLELLGRHGHVLFLVDDNLFVRSFRTSDGVLALQAEPQAIGLSLRLGRNTTFCYSLDKAQRVPELEPLAVHTEPPLLRYVWRTAEHDFGYPLEVSSSLYRSSDLLPLISKLVFRNPNTLEAELARRARSVDKQQLLIYETSVAFCNPVNLVQEAWVNRTNGTWKYSAEQLAERFARGERIAVSRYDELTPNGAHQDVELFFTSASEK